MGWGWGVGLEERRVRLNQEGGKKSLFELKVFCLLFFLLKFTANSTISTSLIPLSHVPSHQLKSVG